jgi:hypothetical protein
LWALAPASAVAAEDSGPVVLTNADVARLHAKPGESDDAARQEADMRSASDDVAAAPDQLAEALALEADLRERLDRISRQSMGSVEQSIDARVSSASQRQLRAKALASSPLVAAPAAPTPGGADVDSDAPDSDTSTNERANDPEPACMYGTHGRLLFEPDGRSCAPIRATSQRTFESGASAAKGAKKHESVGCVYGSRGQLLYSSPDVECAIVEDAP